MQIKKNQIKTYKTWNIGLKLCDVHLPKKKQNFTGLTQNGIRFCLKKIAILREKNHFC